MATDLLKNVRLGWKWLTETNGLAYNLMVLPYLNKSSAQYFERKL
jgi:hypothetical protein